MSRTGKYAWPDDQKLQALLDTHGTAETARQVGCPTSSLSNRIRRRGLRGPEGEARPKADKGNGRPHPAENGTPRAASGNAQSDAPDPAPGESSGGREDRQKSAGSPEKERRRRPGQRLERDGSADYGARGRSWNPAAFAARALNGVAADERPNAAPTFEPGEEARSAAGRSGLRRPSRRPRSTRSDSGRTALRQGLPTALRRLPGPVWRTLAVLALAALAGIAAFASVSGDPKTYQRESSFAVRPSPTVPPTSVNDVIGTLAQPDSAITETIVNMLGSPRLSSFAAHAAGVPPSSVGASGTPYVWTATRRTGSTIIDVRITGPSDDKLLGMQRAAGPEAARLVEDSYTPYRLESLSAPTAAVQVGPKTGRTVGLAILLGGLLGITLLLLERRLRGALGTAPERGGSARAPSERGESRER